MVVMNCMEEYLVVLEVNFEVMIDCLINDIEIEIKLDIVFYVLVM